MKKKLLELNDIAVGYSNTGLILNHVNLTVFENDFLGIIGPNGGGKTTLIKTILGLLSHSEGNISFYKDGVKQECINIGYIPQINQIDRKFPISVYDTILSGFKMKKSLFFRFTETQKQQAKELANKMGIGHLLHKPIGELSGGQLQRILLARATIDRPDLLILDEPNTYIDKQFEHQFYHFLQKLNQNTAIIMVSHDVGTVLSIVKNIACVNSSVHYHEGNIVSEEWLNKAFNCPIDIITHGKIPHRVLSQHTDCDCCDSQ